MKKSYLLSGTIFGVLAVMLGAFGAHGLENLVDKEAIEIWETGVTYQMYHALFLLLVGNIDIRSEARRKWIFRCIVTGIFLFSFSIYLLATNSLTAFDFKVIGLATPFGGLLLIAGWALFGIEILKSQNKKSSKKDL